MILATPKTTPFKFHSYLKLHSSLSTASKCCKLKLCLRMLSLRKKMHESHSTLWSGCTYQYTYLLLLLVSIPVFQWLHSSLSAWHLHPLLPESQHFHLPLPESQLSHALLPDTLPESLFPLCRLLHCSPHPSVTPFLDASTTLSFNIPLFKI